MCIRDRPQAMSDDWSDEDAKLDESTHWAVLEEVEDDMDDAPAAGEMNTDEQGALKAFVQMMNEREQESGVVHGAEIVGTERVVGEEAAVAAMYMDSEFEARLVASARVGAGIQGCDGEESEESEDMDRFFGGEGVGERWQDQALSAESQERVRRGMRGFSLGIASAPSGVRTDEHAKYEAVVQHLSLIHI
eukprot:TRINITY_DN62580_c0_g1_i1.p1 TRINITY_DN62580_c0_g1~~TRINITY_DN62580_c0_g1_i1.p1  ORF type:complete len:200 (+),score=50.34 TRINITY_DN62580_c0_g1_i1:28-600(+)